MIGGAIIGALGAVMVCLVFMARHVRRSGTAGQAVAAAMAAYDQGFHSTAYDAFIEVRAQDDRTHKAPDSAKLRR